MNIEGVAQICSDCIVVSMSSMSGMDARWQKGVSARDLRRSLSRSRWTRGQIGERSAVIHCSELKLTRVSASKASSRDRDRHVAMVPSMLLS